MLNSIKLSIIIVSFNNKLVLQQCLESLYAAEITIPHEIIIVDNASTDGSTEMIEAQHSNVLLIKNNENLMFAKANNQAMAVAQGDYLLLLNSDTIIQKGSIKRLVDFLSAHPKVAAVGPKVLNVDGTLQSKGFPLSPILWGILRSLSINKLPEKLKKQMSAKYFWSADDFAQVLWISGCCMLLKHAVVKEIGGLCEEFFFYCEDTEWCYRANKAKYEIWYVPTAVITHIGGSSTSKPVNNLLLLENFKLLCDKTIGLPKAIIATSVTIPIKFMKYLALRLTRREGSHIKSLKKELEWEFDVLIYLVKKFVFSKKTH